EYIVNFFFFQAEDGIRDGHVTGVQTCALPILNGEDKTTGKCRTAADAENPNFRAEASVRKTLEADPNARILANSEDPFARYGERSEERRVGKECRRGRGPE